MSIFSNLREKCTRFFPAKYIPAAVFVAFLVSLVCCGDNNYIRSCSFTKEINDLKAEIKADEDSTAMYEERVRELNTDRESLEKLAREKYGMKHENEDVYITPMP